MDRRVSLPSASTRRRVSTASRTITPPSTAGGGEVSSKRSGVPRVEYEVEPRVKCIEQQLQKKLPAEWRAFAGAPMQMQYYNKTINTFRDNQHITPSESYIRHAVQLLRQQLELEKLAVLTEQELRDVVYHEWRTDMTRSVWQARLNRHSSKDGPVVRRSKSGVITVTPQPRADEKNFILDAMAEQKKPSRRTKS